MAKSLRPQAPGSFNRVSPGQQDIQVQSSPVDTSVEYGAEGMPAPPVQETPLAPFDPSAGQNELAWANALASGAQMFGQIREMDMQAEQLEQQELATLAQVAQSELIALNMTFSEALEAGEIQAIEHPGIQAGRTRAEAVLMAERFSDQIETEYPSIQDSEALQTLDGANAFFKTQFDEFIKEHRPIDGQEAVFEETIGLARREVLKNLLGKHAVYLGKVNHQKSIEAVGGEVRSHVRAAFNEITNNPDANLESVLDSDMGVALFQNMLDDETRHADGTANTMTRAAYRQHIATALLDIAADRPDQTELAMGIFKGLEYGTRQTKKNGEPAKRSSLLEDSVISEHYNKRFKEIQSNVSRVKGSSASSSDVRRLMQEGIHSQVPRQFIGRKESLMGPPEDGEPSIRTVFANTSSGRRDFAADTGSDGLVSRIISNPEFTETWGEGWEVIPSLSTDDKVVIRNVTTGDPSDEITFDVADLVERGEKARFDHFKKTYGNVARARLSVIRSLPLEEQNSPLIQTEIEKLTGTKDPHADPLPFDEYSSTALASSQSGYIPPNVRRIVENGITDLNQYAILSEGDQDELYTQFMEGYRYWESYQNVSPESASALFAGGDNGPVLPMIYEAFQHAVYGDPDHRVDDRAMFMSIAGAWTEGIENFSVSDANSNVTKVLADKKITENADLIREIAQINLFIGKLTKQPQTAEEAVANAQKQLQVHYSTVGGNPVPHSHFGFGNMELLPEIQRVIGTEEGTGFATRWLREGGFEGQSQEWKQAFVDQLPSGVRGDLTSARYSWVAVRNKPFAYTLNVFNPDTQSRFPVSNPSSPTGHFDTREMSKHVKEGGFYRKWTVDYTSPRPPAVKSDDDVRVAQLRAAAANPGYIKDRLDQQGVFAPQVLTGDYVGLSQPGVSRLIETPTLTEEMAREQMTPEQLERERVRARIAAEQAAAAYDREVEERLKANEGN